MLWGSSEVVVMVYLITGYWRSGWRTGGGITCYWTFVTGYGVVFGLFLDYFDFLLIYFILLPKLENCQHVIFDTIIKTISISFIIFIKQNDKMINCIMVQLKYLHLFIRIVFNEYLKFSVDRSKRLRLYCFSMVV